MHKILSLVMMVMVMMMMMMMVVFGCADYGMNPADENAPSEQTGYALSKPTGKTASEPTKFLVIRNGVPEQGVVLNMGRSISGRVYQNETGTITGTDMDFYGRIYGRQSGYYRIFASDESGREIGSWGIVPINPGDTWILMDTGMREKPLKLPLMPEFGWSEMFTWEITDQVQGPRLAIYNPRDIQFEFTGAFEPGNEVGSIHLFFLSTDGKIISLPSRSVDIEHGSVEFSMYLTFEHPQLELLHQEVYNGGFGKAWMSFYYYGKDKPFGEKPAVKRASKKMPRLTILD